MRCIHYQSADRNGMDIREATDEYLTWLVDVRNPSQHTIRAYTGDLRQWLEHVLMTPT